MRDDNLSPVLVFTTLPSPSTGGLWTARDQILERRKWRLGKKRNDFDFLLTFDYKVISVASDESVQLLIVLTRDSYRM